MSSHWFTGYLVLSANTGAMIQVPCIYLFFLFLPLPLPKHLKAKQQSSCCQRTRNPRAAPHSQAPETATASPMRASSVPCAKRKARDEDFRHLDRDSRGATFGSMAPSTTGSCHRHSSQSWRWINVNYHWITLSFYFNPSMKSMDCMKPIPQNALVGLRPSRLVLGEARVRQWQSSRTQMLLATT